MPDFIINALVAGVGIAVVMGAVGVFVVWRRMAYFGDTLAHSALLGVAIGFLAGINANIGIIAVCLIIAISMVYLRRQQQLAEDTLLGILAHSSLALGLVGSISSGAEIAKFIKKLDNFNFELVKKLNMSQTKKYKSPDR